jgi:hypothetical protein
MSSSSLSLCARSCPINDILCNYKYRLPKVEYQSIAVEVVVLPVNLMFASLQICFWAFHRIAVAQLQEQVSMNLLKVLQHNGGPWLRAPANSVRQAQVLTKVHLPRSRARVVWLPPAPKRQQNSLCRWMQISAKTKTRVGLRRLVLYISKRRQVSQSSLQFCAHPFRSSTVRLRRAALARIR